MPCFTYIIFCNFGIIVPSIVALQGIKFVMAFYIFHTSRMCSWFPNGLFVEFSTMLRARLQFFFKPGFPSRVILNCLYVFSSAWKFIILLSLPINVLWASLASRSFKSSQFMSLRYFIILLIFFGLNRWMAISTDEYHY